MALLKAIYVLIFHKECRDCGEFYPRGYADLCPHCLLSVAEEVTEAIDRISWQPDAVDDDLWVIFRDPTKMDEPLDIQFGFGEDGRPYGSTDDGEGWFTINTG